MRTILMLLVLGALACKAYAPFDVRETVQVTVNCDVDDDAGSR